MEDKPETQVSVDYHIEWQNQQHEETLKIKDAMEDKPETQVSVDYHIEWQNKQHEETITISKSYFEHLLNCLANQHFIGEPPPNGDAASLESSEYYKIQVENQNIINKAWSEGMFLLCLDHKIGAVHKEMIEKYCEVWNKNFTVIGNYISDDKEQYPHDTNISFKWIQLVSQEIEMWIRLCCFSVADIDYKNEKYTPGTVGIEDFNNICERRGFTPNMRSFLIYILKDIGIGDEL